MSRRIRVLLADDSATERTLMSSILGADPGLDLVGAARDGLEAMELIRRLRPDVAVLDVYMPALGGIEATERIMTEMPLPIVVVSSSLDGRQLKRAFEALRAGAVATHSKPAGPSSEEFERDARALVTTVKLMADVKVVGRRIRPVEPARAPVVDQPVSIIAVTASTGGPAAALEIASALSADFPLPILWVQHIGAGWAQGLADWLAASVSIPVRIAEEGAPLAPGLWLAPDGRHLGVHGRDRLLVSWAPRIQGFRPSGTFLLESVARVFGRQAAGVILTGMGDDGVAGLRALKAAGGLCVAQDRRSSIVHGMPGAAIAAGIVDRVVALDEVAPLMRSLAGLR